MTFCSFFDRISTVPFERKRNLFKIMKTKDTYPSYLKEKGIGMILIVVLCAVSYKTLIIDSYQVNQTSLQIKSSYNELTKEQIINNFISENENLISFYADTFQIDENILKEHIVNSNLINDEFLELDIFNVGTTFNSKDESMLNYLLNLEIENPKLFSKKKVPCNKDKEYILGLIDYFTTIYKEVDPSLAKAIGLVESGYTSKTMLNKNNIFGGMSSKGLITYKNINYGVLKYIKLLNDSYYQKGLDTVEKIGRKYNPVIDKNSKKVASPTWVSNVKKYQNKYQSRIVNNLDDLLAI